MRKMSMGAYAQNISDVSAQYGHRGTTATFVHVPAMGDNGEVYSLCMEWTPLPVTVPNSTGGYFTYDSDGTLMTFPSCYAHEDTPKIETMEHVLKQLELHAGENASTWYQRNIEGNLCWRNGRLEKVPNYPYTP